MRHPVHTYIFLRYDILFLRYIPAGSDLELECQVDLGDHGPDDHYRYFSFLVTGIMHVFCNSTCILQLYLYCICLTTTGICAFPFCLHVLCIHVCILKFHLYSTMISVLSIFVCCRQTAVLHWLVNGRVLDPGKEGEQEKRVTASQRIAGYLFQVCVLYSFDLSQPSIPLISW